MDKSQSLRSVCLALVVGAAVLCSLPLSAAPKTKPAPPAVAKTQAVAPAPQIPIVRTGPVSFAWDASPDSSIDGYRLYVDGAKAGETKDLTFTVAAGFPVGDHSAYVTAFNAAGESDPSNTIAFQVISKPFPPGNLRLNASAFSAAP